MRRPASSRSRVSPLNRTTVILMVIFLSTAIVATGYGLATSPIVSSTDGRGFNYTPSLHQGLSGKVVISNTSPVCFAGQNGSPAAGPNILITSADGRVVTLRPEWTLVHGCELAAQFNVLLQVGTYSITTSPCEGAACWSTPAQFIVDPGVFTTISVQITTGIY